MKRLLSREEAALWNRLAGTVRPLEGDRTTLANADPPRRQRLLAGGPLPSLPPMAMAAQRAREDALARSLDSAWDRKLAKGLVAPDFTIDLHGASLEAAHSRLEHLLSLAVAQGARTVLLVTGKPRPADGNGGRGERRGAIRAKFADWLAHGQHAGRIAAIRPAHPRHGGAGAVYIVLRRTR